MCSSGWLDWKSWLGWVSERRWPSPVRAFAEEYWLLGCRGLGFKCAESRKVRLPKPPR